MKLKCVLHQNRRHFHAKRILAKVSTIVDETHRLQRLDCFLYNKLKVQSRSFISSLCDLNKVTVNGVLRPKSFKVITGDTIVIDLPEVLTPGEPQPENIPLSILYEDSDLIIINKPSGMVVHPSPGTVSGTFVNALLNHIGDGRSKELIHHSLKNSSLESLHDMDDTVNDGCDNTTSLSQRPGIVHRLDKGTSGVLIAAKHPEAVDRMMNIFSSRNIMKYYLAVCVGNPGEITITTPIGRNPQNRKAMTTLPDGRSAITHIRPLAFDGKLSFALLAIETGRTHQIRVHLKDRKTPVLGDDLYGSKIWNRKYSEAYKIDRPLLHAYEVRFQHPFSGKNMVVAAPIPQDMSHLVRMIVNHDILRGYDLQDAIIMNGDTVEVDTSVLTINRVSNLQRSLGTPIIRKLGIDSNI